MSDILLLPADTYTYVSHTYVARTSWLDHILFSKLNLIYDIEVFYDITIDNHTPF